MQATTNQADFIANAINAYLATMMQSACVNDNFLEEQSQCEHVEYNLQALNEFLVNKDIGKLVRALNAQKHKQAILRGIVQADVGLTPAVLCKALIAV